MIFCRAFCITPASQGPCYSSHLSVLPINTILPNTANEYGVFAHFCFVQPNREQLNHLYELANEGQLKVNIDSEFTSREVAKAHERSETGRAPHSWGTSPMIGGSQGEGLLVLMMSAF